MSTVDHTHIALDLETFGSVPTASIAAIGAAADDPLHSTFYCVVDDPAGSFSPDTIRWHARQDDPAGNVGANAPVTLPLDAALQEFGAWLLNFHADEEGEACLWTHATFDMPVLHSACDRAGVEVAWNYRNCRDLRTLYDFAGGAPDIEDNDAHHHARADAEYHLREVLTCLETIENA